MLLIDSKMRRTRSHLHAVARSAHAAVLVATLRSGVLVERYPRGPFGPEGRRYFDR